MQKVEFDTIDICEGYHCKECGWPTIHACVNWDADLFPSKEHLDLHPEDEGADFWVYCSNKSCKHHTGRAWGQDVPDFLEKN